MRNDYKLKDKCWREDGKYINSPHDPDNPTYVDSVNNRLNYI